MKKILTKVIGFLEDFDLEEESAKIVGLKGNPIDQLKGEMVISLGGDGTLLYILDNLNKPVFGINCGGVGFLTEIEHSEDMFSAFKRLESKNYKLQRLGRVDAFINNLKVGTVSDLIRYRLKNTQIVQLISERPFDSKMGKDFTLKISYF